MNSGSEKRTELADERTDLAEDRTVMANERTFAGWLRTGLAAVGIGLGFNALFSKLSPPWAPKLIATVFMGVGVFIFYAAQRQAAAVLKRLETHESAPVSGKYVRVIASLMGAASISLIAATWFLKWTD